MNWYERVGVGIGVLGFVVSLWALKQSHESLELTQQRMKSKLVVRVDQKLAQEDVTFSKYDTPLDYPVVYRQRYQLMINNIGYQPVSITSWRFLATMPWIMPDTGKLGYGRYRGLNPRVSHMSGKTVRLPLKVAQQEPLVLTVELGLRVPASAWRAVSDVLDPGVTYSYRKAKDEFAKAGYADFGQTSHMKRDIDSGRIISSNGSKRFEQRIHIYMTKGNGREVMVSLYPHVGARYVESDDGEMMRRP